MRRAPSRTSVRYVSSVDVSFFSVHPERGECLYPPGTYLELRSEASVAAVVEGGGGAGVGGARHEAKCTVIEAAPQLNLLALPAK